MNAFLGTIGSFVTRAKLCQGWLVSLATRYDFKIIFLLYVIELSIPKMLRIVLIFMVWLNMLYCKQ